MGRKKVFADRNEKARVYYERYKPRIKAYRAAWYQKHKEEAKFKRLLAKYGLTRAEYEALAAAQNNCCFLCDRPAEKDRDGVLHVDHDHATGRVRKLLCSQCNVGLGLFQDDPDLLRRAADYVT